MKINDMYKKVIEVKGNQHQINKAMEELTELRTALECWTSIDGVVTKKVF